MKKAIFTLFILFIAFIACNVVNTTQEEYVLDYFTSQHVYQDTLSFELSFKRAQFMIRASYIPFYLGPVSDTVAMNYQLVPFPPPHPPSLSPNDTSDHIDRFEHHRSLCYSENKVLPPESYSTSVVSDSAEIQLFVDTTALLTSLDFEHDQERLFAFKGYPIILKNISTEHAKIGYGTYLDLILEAQDQHGAWKPIERNYNYICGNGIELISLGPSQIAISTVPLFKGKFQTKLRVRQRLGERVSNEFSGSINEGQFNKEF